MPTAVALGQLVDLALGSPEVGAVNFNVLHTLLHAMIQKLNIQDVKADIDEHDRELLSTHTGPRAYSAFSVISADSGKGEDSFSMSEDNLSEKSSYATPKRSAYHKLEKQVAELTRQMEEFNKLPSNELLMNRTQGKDTERPVSDMWQYMQLKKRVDANEEGVGKVKWTFV
ncbi:glutamine-rich protein 2 [Elysia marginata]|uniref:Glutamine-rich protein 2 n=1 Tax=Elysia marginata TaxID=1093978 RepID=A0AAV4HW77_9GAST|nr:glutamine-rich protein 2 [Elysia marginata]